MLVLERKTGQSVFIQTPAGKIEVWVTESTRDRVKLGFDAPTECVILREEVADSGKDQ